MRSKSVAILLALALVVLAAAGCAGDQQASEDNAENQATTEDIQRIRPLPSNSENTSGKARGREATLELQGDPGTEVSGSCAVGDQVPEEISEQLPASFTYELKGRALDCEISSDRDVRVDLNIGENVRSVQRISGGTLNLTYENGSISSVVSSSSGSNVQGSSSSSQVVSSTSAETIDQEPSETANGSGNVTSESRNVSDFDEVELNGVGNLSIQQTGSESLIVEAEEDVIPKLRTEVENNRLVIGPKPNTSIHTSEPINYKLTVEDLNALEVSGSGNIDAEDISTDELAVTISGAGDVKTSGRADSQDIDISGSGDYKARNLESEEAKIEVGGTGSAIVNVSNELNAKVSGSGSVEYIGAPTVDQEVSGAGRVSEY